MTDWRDHAACRDNPGPFYPGLGQNPHTAKRICADCPVRSECLEYALDTFQRHGIWGGTSERERRKLWRQRAAAA